MSTYSTNLALELIGTGEQAGTWGNTTNTNLGTLIEQAISGYVTQAVATGTDTTLTIPNGATGVARNMYIELTGTGGTNTNLIVPSNKKLYFIYNNSTGAVTVKVSGQTGVSVAATEKKILVSNGTDIVEATSYITAINSSLTLTTLNATSANITTLSGTAVNYGSATISTGNLIVSSGNVGIGTASPGSFYSEARNLVVGTGTGGQGMTIYAGTASQSRLMFADGTTGSDPYTGFVQYDHSSNALAFGTNGGTERMRIDSSGNVGIGTASPTASGAGYSVLHINNATTGGQLHLTGGGSGAAATDGTLISHTNTELYVTNQENGPTIFFNNGSERARITSGGNVGIGVNPGTANIRLYVKGANQTAGQYTIAAQDGSGNNTFLVENNGKVSDQYGNIRAIPRTGSEKTSAYTLTVSDVGQYVQVGTSGSVTVPNNTFATGDVVSVFNNTTGNVTLTMSITTAYIGGTNTDKDTITLATRGVATILFISGTVCVVNGNVS